MVLKKCIHLHVGWCQATLCIRSMFQLAIVSVWLCLFFWGDGSTFKQRELALASSYRPDSCRARERCSISAMEIDCDEWRGDGVAGTPTTDTSTNLNRS